MNANCSTVGTTWRHSHLFKICRWTVHKHTGRCLDANSWVCELVNEPHYGFCHETGLCLYVTAQVKDTQKSGSLLAMGIENAGFSWEHLINVRIWVSESVRWQVLMQLYWILDYIAYVPCGGFCYLIDLKWCDWQWQNDKDIVIKYNVGTSNKYSINK